MEYLDFLLTSSLKRDLLLFVNCLYIYAQVPYMYLILKSVLRRNSSLTLLVN